MTRILENVFAGIYKKLCPEKKGCGCTSAERAEEECSVRKRDLSRNDVMVEDSAR